MSKTKPEYFICVAATGGDTLIPGAQHIEMNGENPVFNCNYNAARQAEADGIPIIHDMPGIENWTYVDTPKNRAIINKWLTDQVGKNAIETADQLVREYNTLLIAKHGSAVSIRFKYHIDKNKSIRYFYTGEVSGIDMPCDDDFETIDMAYMHASKFILGG